MRWISPSLVSTKQGTWTFTPHGPSQPEPSGPAGHDNDGSTRRRRRHRRGNHHGEVPYEPSIGTSEAAESERRIHDPDVDPGG